MKKTIITFVILCLAITKTTFAHQPRITISNETTVPDPEISKAYYATLSSGDHIYHISSTKNFELFVNILVPYSTNAAKDITATIVKKWNEQIIITQLNGNDFTWTKFFEPFGHDTYRMWPTYKADATAWEYDIIISSPIPHMQYSLAIGEQEVFDLAETINAVTLIPKIKQDFFHESSLSFILSPLGRGFVLITLLWGFVFGFIYRQIAKRFSSSASPRWHVNINSYDRWLRAVAGLWLLIRAITTTWSPILLLFAGFCFFEAIFSRCGFYALLGKSSCPIDA